MAKKKSEAAAGMVRFESSFKRHVLVMPDGGRSIRFMDGVYETAKEEEIAFLRKHPANPVDFHEVEPEAPADEEEAE